MNQTVKKWMMHRTLVKIMTLVMHCLLSFPFHTDTLDYFFGMICLMDLRPNSQENSKVVMFYTVLQMTTQKWCLELAIVLLGHGKQILPSKSQRGQQ